LGADIATNKMVKLCDTILCAQVNFKLIHNLVFRVTRIPKIQENYR
jgi:hypothetical protein